MTMHNNRIILALGSNQRPEANIQQARLRIEQILPAVSWSTAIYTEPIRCVNPNLFLNCVGIASTPLTISEIHTRFKEIEHALGRRPDSKQTGIIPIDIDLIQYNNEVLKPDDLMRDYIKAALFGELRELYLHI